MSQIKLVRRMEGVAVKLLGCSGELLCLRYGVGYGEVKRISFVTTRCSTSSPSSVFCRLQRVSGFRVQAWLTLRCASWFLSHPRAMSGHLLQWIVICIVKLRPTCTRPIILYTPYPTARKK